MSLPELRGTGRLLADPRTGTTSTGTPYASALVKFPQWRKTDDGWAEGEGAVASVVTYDDTATLLANYAKGDDIGVHGSCRPAIYRDKPQLSITATSIWTPEKTARTTTAKTSQPDGNRTGQILAEARAAAAAERQQYKDRLSARQAESAA